MASGRSQRKLSNVRLTQEFHFRHMGLWVMITVGLIVAVNALLYMLIIEAWKYAGNEVGGAPLDPIPRGVTIGMAVETLLFSVATVFLAKLTSHRAAGPFIGLQKTCEAIRDGDHSRRQHFREYDGLKPLEQAFNGMVDALVEKTD